MRIVVNDIAASYGGALTVLKSFYSYIKENDKNNDYIFLLSDKYLEETEKIKIVLLPNVKKSWLHKLYFDFFVGKRLLKKLQPDRVISLQNIITFGYKGEQSVYVHQSIPFQTAKRFSLLKEEERSLAVYQYFIGSIIKCSIRKANRVYVQTEWMKRSIVAQCHVPTEKIEVVPFETENIKNPLPYIGCGKRFFYPTTSESVYKNHAIIYEADSILQKDGIENYTITLTLDKNNTPGSTINYIGILEKNELYKEYANSVLLFPSYVETVGLPLIEAMEIGAFIIVADCEYAREVLGDYSNVMFFNPFSSKELAEIMKKCISGELSICGQRKSINHMVGNWKKMLDSLK